MGQRLIGAFLAGRLDVPADDANSAIPPDLKGG
jgi:hypothetical protein